MVKSFIKFSGYIFLKWVCFYSYVFIANKTLLKWDQKTSFEGVILLIGMLFIIPLLELLILFLPFNLFMKQKGWKTLFVLALAFSLEFLLTWSTTNQQIAIWMVVKIAISIILYLLLYQKQLIRKNREIAF